MNDDVPNGWGPRLADLAARKEAAHQMGGPERVARQHAKGSLTVRERVDHLLDGGSFREIGPLVGEHAADALITGWGRVDGRPVLVGAEDFTVLGGSIGPGNTAKRYRVAELALQERVPLVMILEGAGHRPAMPGDPPHHRAPSDLLAQARLSGYVPFVTAVLGSSAGHGALTAPMSDFTVMAANSAIFTAGPPLVKSSIGEDISKEDLGGPQVSVVSGVIHNVAPDDKTALDVIRDYLSYFPSSSWAYAPHGTGADQGRRRLDELLDVIPVDGRRLYDMRHVISVLVDDGTFFQVQPDFGETMITALAHIGGEPVAIVANQPAVKGGSIDSDGADKGARFLQIADSYHLPIVNLCDNPGVLAGSDAERAGILRHGGRMFAAQVGTQTPKFHVTLRKAYGFGGCIMGMLGFNAQTATYAFPGATLGAMPASGSSKATRADEDTTALLRQAELESSYKSARGLGFDELLDPRDLRNVLIDGLEVIAARRDPAPQPVSRVGFLP
ncbi:MAG TPA: carboxyl transferase domain-containing protein [Acidimicrobiales bacterium]|jgi:acetyl-CoA carboxylase carboxyltransferase component|nr:carboxyl transferase domain-containing protein [Acidimicrobiales bacterium]